MDKHLELANLVFPDVKETIADLEKKYPKRNLPQGAMVTRFAPSPTGFLHTGSLFASAVSQKVAKQTQGVFYIRLEDTDQKREVAGSGKLLVEQMKRFGVVPDEGYMGDEEVGNYGPYVQSKRADIYKVVIKEMLKKDLAYLCFCSANELSEMRKAQQAKKENFGYYGKYAKCSFMSVEEQIAKVKSGKEYVIRFRSHGDYHNKVSLDDAIRGHIEIAQNDQHVVIYKSDGLPTYHFAHLVDDHFMRTTHVTRGEEWLPSVPIHLELFSAMDWQAPTYCHLPVIMKLDNGVRRKLSKRKDSEAAVSYFLEKGYPVDGFMEYLYTISNSNYEAWRNANRNASRDEFNFDFSKMSLDGALFDLDKVKNLCKEYLGNLSCQDMYNSTYAYAKEFDSELKALFDRDNDYMKEILSIEREKDNPRKDYEKYSDIKDLILFFFSDYYDKMVKDLQLPENISKEVIIKVLQEYSKIVDLEKTEDEWFMDMKNLALSMNFAKNNKLVKKNPGVYNGSVADFANIIRLAETLRSSSPNLYIVLKIIQKTEVVRRLENLANSLLN